MKHRNVNPIFNLQADKERKDLKKKQKNKQRKDKDRVV